MRAARAGPFDLILLDVMLPATARAGVVRGESIELTKQEFDLL